MIGELFLIKFLHTYTVFQFLNFHNQKKSSKHTWPNKLQYTRSFILPFTIWKLEVIIQTVIAIAVQ